MLAYFGVMGYLLGYLRGPTAEFIYNEQILEGEHRGFIARILQHAEEIASLAGAKRELSTLTTSLSSLLSHLRNKYMYKATVNTLDQVFARYLSNSIGPWSNFVFVSDLHLILVPIQLTVAVALQRQLTHLFLRCHLRL